MANQLVRSRKDFSFQNRRLSSDVPTAQAQQRRELEDMYNALQQQMADDFNQLAKKLASLETRLEALE